jgi:uncharacterized membrane protein YqjE
VSETFTDRGLFASLRHLLGTSLEIAQVRLELLGTEIELEKRRIFDQLLQAAIALMTLGVGLALFCGFVLMLFWEHYRLAASGVLAAAFLTAGALLLRQARQSTKSPESLFSASLAELKRDRVGLQPTPPDEKR